VRIKADWTNYLHNLRRQEMEVVFRNCPKKLFGKVLELGAGDGFVSSIFTDYTEQLVCTDLNPDRLNKTNRDNITFKICDAEEISEVFKDEQFDMIFSSSLLEHLPDCEKALAEIHQALADTGVCIHLLPNRYWKLVTILLHIPNKIAVVVDKAFAGRLFKRRPGHKWRKPYKQTFGGNNMKLGRRKQFLLSKPFLPRIHGISSNTITEFITFGKKQWGKKFESAGFKVLAVKKVVFNSGYGFNFARLRKLMEHLGFHTLYAYIMCKAGHESKYTRYFMDSGESK